mgnify:CR=1 FL=1
MVKYAILTQRVRKKKNGKPSRKEWALVSKTRKSKDGKRRVLRWFGPKKPSKKRVAEAERIIHSHSGAIDGVVENSADDRKDITDYFDIPTKLPRNLKINIDTKASLPIFDKLEKLSFFLSKSNLCKEAADIKNLWIDPSISQWADGSPTIERVGRGWKERAPDTSFEEREERDRKAKAVNKLTGPHASTFMIRTNERVKRELFKILSNWYSSAFEDWEYDTDFNMEDFSYADENFGFSSLDVSFIELMHEALDNLGELNITEAIGSLVGAVELLPFGHRDIAEDIEEIQRYENLDLASGSKESGETRLSVLFARSHIVEKLNHWIQGRSPNFEEMYSLPVEEIEEVINRNIPDLTEETFEYLQLELDKIKDMLETVRKIREDSIIGPNDPDEEPDISDIGEPLSTHGRRWLNWPDPNGFREYGDIVRDPIELVGGDQDLDDIAAEQANFYDVGDYDDD